MILQCRSRFVFVVTHNNLHKCSALLTYIIAACVYAIVSVSCFGEINNLSPPPPPRLSTYAIHGSFTLVLCFVFVKLYIYMCVSCFWETTPPTPKIFTYLCNTQGSFTLVLCFVFMTIYIWSAYLYSHLDVPLLHVRSCTTRLLSDVTGAFYYDML